MKKEMGVWIDQSKAVIVALTPRGEAVWHIEADIEKWPGLFVSSRESSSSKSTPASQFLSRTNRFYEMVVSIIRDAKAILIIGPGEAKNQLAFELTKLGLDGRIDDIQADGELTDRQISGKVNRHFSNNRRQHVIYEDEEKLDS